MSKHDIPAVSWRPHLVRELERGSGDDEIYDAEAVGAVAEEEEVALERRLTQPVAIVRRALDELLTANLYRIAHRNGERSIWRADQSATTRIRRALDFSDRYKLPGAGAVEVTVAREGGMTRVQLALRLDRTQRRSARALLGFALAGAALAVAGTAVFGTMLWDGIAIAAGVGTAIAGWVPVRGRHGAARFAGDNLLEQILDDLAEVSTRPTPSLAGVAARRLRTTPT